MIKIASKINDDELIEEIGICITNKIFLLLKLFHNLFLELFLNQNLMKNKMRKLRNKFLYS